MAPPESPGAGRPAFALEYRIGAGGMGVVWRARHQRQRTPIAVKFLKVGETPAAGALRGFLREVRAVASLSHPGICAVYDHGRSWVGGEAGDSTEVPAGPWLAMELAEGCLTPWCGRLAWSQQRAWLVQLLNALAYTHARGIIHRDIKPNNVLCFGDRVKLTDFGLAWAGGKAASHGGTPWYMAPEQAACRWRDFGPWTDLYALGGTAWMMACGVPPRVWRAPPASGRYPPLPAFRPAMYVPAGLEEWLRTMLAIRPGERFATPAHARDALEALGDGVNGGVRGPVGSDDPVTQPVLELAARPSDPDDADATWSFVDSPPLDLGSDRGRGPSRVSSGVDPAEEIPFDVPPVQALRPLPDCWRQGVSPMPRLFGAGLGLFGLRAVPLVGRDVEQDALWARLRSVSRGCAVVTMSGEAGSGKSRLAAWLCHRVLEAGAATVLRATHSLPAGPMDGVRSALIRYLQTEGLSHAEAAGRIGRRLPGLSPEALTSLARLLHPVPHEPDPRSEAEQRAALVDVVQRISGGQPLILWLDDAQWSREGVLLARELITTHPAAPVLIVLTIRSCAPVDPAAGPGLDALRAHPATVELPIHPLQHQTLRTLADALLGLSSPLSDAVVARAEGNPLFLIQLIGDWVERGILTLTTSGFALVEGAEVVVPDAVHELWMSRVERLLVDRPASAAQALELASLLGVQLETEEWAAACAHAGLEIPEELLDGMHVHGLMLPTRTGWRFAHGLLAESLRRGAQVAGRLPGHQQVIGQVLMERGRTLSDEGSCQRAADVLARAGQVLGDGVPTALRAEALLVTANNQRILGRVDDAEAIIQGVLSGDPPLVSPWLEAEAYRLLGILALERGRLEASEAHLEQALAAARIGDQPALVGLVLRNLGSVFMDTARLDRAGVLFEEALLFTVAHGSPRERMILLGCLGTLHQNQGRFDDARVVFDQALHAARELGLRRDEGIVLSNLAQLLSTQGEVAAAVQTGLAARKIHEEVGDQGWVAITLANLANLHVNLGQEKIGEEYLESAVEICRAAGFLVLEGYAHGSLGRLYARQRELDRARRCLEAACSAHERAGYPPPMGGWQAYLALIASWEDRPWADLIDQAVASAAAFPEARCVALRIRARLRCAAGDLPGAREDNDEARALCTDWEQAALLAVADARLAWMEGRLDAARGLLQPAVDQALAAGCAPVSALCRRIAEVEALLGRVGGRVDTGA